MTTTSPAGAADAAPKRRSIAVWVLRQTALGLLIMSLVMGTTAWLLHASIDPAAELPVEEAPVRQG